MKVVISERISGAAKGLLDGHEVVEVDHGSEDFFEEIEDAEALVVRTYTQVDSSLLDRADKLRYVLRCGVGMENIDVEECESRGVKVFNAPGSNAVSVAEHTVLMVLASLRKLIHCHEHVKSGGWNRSLMKGSELRAKTVGLVGFGAIGREVARRLSGFGANIAAFDVYMDHAKAEELGVEPVELDELLKRSDIVSIHVPLLDSTRHMVDSEFIAKMKNGSILVNTSRGGVVDEEALVEGLRSNLSFAALDVFEDEPPNGGIIGMENVVLSPHIAGVTEESFERMCTQPVRMMLDDLEVPA